MSAAAKFFDVVLGFDTHLYNVPTPAPVLAPLPTPLRPERLGASSVARDRVRPPAAGRGPAALVTFRQSPGRALLYRVHGATWEHVPGHILGIDVVGMGRLYPHIMVVATDPLERVHTAIRFWRPDVRERVAVHDPAKAMDV